MRIIHGKNTESSRTYFLNLINQSNLNTIRLGGLSLKITGLIQNLEAKTFFETQNLVIIENIFKRRESKEKEEIFKYLKDNLFENLILWEDNQIDGRKLIAFSKAKIQRFDYSPYIFKYLDSIFPNNQKNILFLFKQTLKQEPVELIFFHLSKRIRDLIIAADLSKQGLTGMADWQQNKLIYQAKKFDLLTLKRIYKNLLKIDYQIKSGKSQLDLTFHLDLLLSSL